MRKIRFTIMMLLVTAYAMTASAQSMSMAKYYYEQGKYLEAAKQLRPLADGGNAEAQAMAARMFFEGKGVQKNDAQGEKYATMAADQGNEDAILLLADYYVSKDQQKAVTLLKTSIEKFPKSKEGKVNDKYKTLVSCSSQETPTLVGNAPSQVVAGQKFRLTYTVNTQDVTGFHIDNFPSAFEVIFGPSASTQTSFQIINGETKQSSSITYTYILQASKNGSFTIPAAHITAQGKTIQSNTLNITVSGTSDKKDSSDKKAITSSSDITDSDLFMAASIDKKNIRLGDSLTLTLKLYTLVNVSTINAESSPDIEACFFQEQSLPHEKQFTTESYKGKNYRTVIWQEYTIVPLKTGTIIIHPQKFDCIITAKKENTDVDPFEAFFNGNTNFVEIKKSIYSPQLSFTVYE
ncbi:MAG: BatD family protein [Prevotella sp.]|nr:BatD family protein [Prevotella sp.]